MVRCSPKIYVRTCSKVDAAARAFPVAIASRLEPFRAADFAGLRRVFRGGDGWLRRRDDRGTGRDGWRRHFRRPLLSALINHAQSLPETPRLRTTPTLFSTPFRGDLSGSAPNATRCPR